MGLGGGLIVRVPLLQTYCIVLFATAAWQQFLVNAVAWHTIHRPEAVAAEENVLVCHQLQTASATYVQLARLQTAVAESEAFEPHCQYAMHHLFLVVVPPTASLP